MTDPEAIAIVAAIADAKARLQEAEARAAVRKEHGTQEQYLESYFVVEVLEKRLDDLLRAQKPG